MKSILRKTGAALLTAAACSTAPAALARDYIHVVGSSTVYPFATVVAERLGRALGLPTPTVESTGTGGGLKLFCSGVGLSTPDVANASRRIERSEFDSCQANGVREIVEVNIGFDGIVVANSKAAPQLSLTRRQLFLALAKEIPAADGSGKLIPNPHRTWRDLDPALPAEPIEVLGPPPTSGTRDNFVELVLQAGCASFPELAALKARDEGRFKQICHTVREDGAWVDAGENDNLIVQKLEKNPHAVGVFGFSFLEQNADKVQAARIDGAEPSFETIADGSYPVARPIYFYVKKAHVGVVPGLPEYVREFTSERAIGDEGYLVDKGLIPLPADQRERVRQKALAFEPLAAADL